jgi:uncharacterized membrane protein YtjA (UPF0391 family)
MGLLKWSVILAVLALVAGILGFTNLAEGFADIAKVLFFIFLVGVALLVGAGLFVWNKATGTGP